MLGQFMADEEGATAVEYSMVASMVALAIVGALMLLSGNVQTLWDEVAKGMGDANAAP